jgi:protein-L-isoaspartate O-methyltransferase
MVTVCAWLAVPKPWLGKLKDAGVAVAVVAFSFAVHKGVIQIPRP